MEGTPRKITFVAANVLAVALGLLAGLFVDFNVVFSDIFGWQQRAWSFVYVAVSYGVLGAAFGAAGPARRTRWFWMLATPGMALMLLMAATALFPPEPFFVALSLAVLVTTAAATLGGLTAGAAVRRRRSL